MTEPVSLKIELPNIPRIELVALEGLEHLARYMGIADEKIGEARVLVTEAIINALEHAGQDGAPVQVEFTMTKNELTIFVRDFGKGFRPDAVRPPDLHEKLSSQNRRGWGLHLMKTLSDDFRIESHDSGTKITLIKKLA